MAASVKGTMSLPSGLTTRLVDAGVGANPRYFLEYAEGTDSMGVTRWLPTTGFTPADVIVILQATGYIT